MHAEVEDSFCKSLQDIKIKENEAKKITETLLNSNGNKYVLNGASSYSSTIRYGLSTGTYTFTGIPSDHPLAILNNGNSNITYSGDNNNKFTKSVSGTSYDFFHGDVTVTVTGDFGNVSLYCYYHGYMGGENLLVYSSKYH